MKPRLTVTLLLALFAVLASVPFMAPRCGAIALVALVPLLWADKIASEKSLKGFWWMQFAAFFAFNFITTFWIRNATLGGALFAIIANATQMAIIFGIFRYSKKFFAGVLPYIFLMLMWIAFERNYFNVQISWPWLTLGNSFARSIRLVQWYEYTGVMGGTLWIWLSNLAIFLGLSSILDGSFFSRWNPKARVAYVIGFVMVVFGPMVVSKVIWNRYQETDDPVKVIIGQPNFDPYQKFSSMTQTEQNLAFMDLVRPCLDADSLQNAVLIAPETFTSGLVINNIDNDCTIKMFRNFLKPYPNVSLLMGASAVEFVEKGHKHSECARWNRNNHHWYESRNSAVLLEQDKSQVYHKSKLVVGVEMTPYPKIFLPLDNALGNVMGRCVGQDEASVLKTPQGNKIGCAVCYESVYGEYCTQYIAKGADVLAVITNDAWWGNTAGYRQHLSYASLRAIETRRDIARCANTGISAIINQKGEILSSTSWWVPEALTGVVNASHKVTFFVSNGDIVGRVSTFAFLLLALALLVRIIKNRL